MPTLLLDLDGTVADTLPDIAAALNRMLAGRGLAPYAIEEVRRMVGDGSPRLAERALAGRGQGYDRAALDGFLAEYMAAIAVESRLYPAVVPVLRRLAAAGWRAAICTNKPEAAARRLLQALGVVELFDTVGGGDSFPSRKPDPAHVLATLHAAGGNTDAAVMLGDHRNDILAGRGAGIPAVFASWGYGEPEMADGAAAVADGFAALPGILARLLPGG